MIPRWFASSTVLDVGESLMAGRCHGYGGCDDGERTLH